MKTRRWFAGILVGAAIGGAACGAEEPATPAAGAPSSAATEPADDPADNSSGGKAESTDPGANYNDQYNFTATTFDGETFELATYKGTPVVINFWESW